MKQNFGEASKTLGIWVMAIFLSEVCLILMRTFGKIPEAIFNLFFLYSLLCLFMVLIHHVMLLMVMWKNYKNKDKVESV